MKKNETENSKALFELMHEVGKTQPDHKILKTLCDKANIVYEKDIIQLMAKILIEASHIKTNSPKTSVEA